MNLYELNKAAYASFKPLDIFTLNARKEEFEKFLAKGKYYMLLCNELKYYTVFVKQKENNFHQIATEFISIVMELGEVLDIEYSKTMTAYEVWIRDKVTKEINMYALFNYDGGVIEC